MSARFAFEEGLVGAANVHSDYDESEEEHEEEHIAEYEELHQIYERSIPDEAYQRWYRRGKRKET